MNIIVKGWKLPECCSCCPFYKEGAYGDMDCLVTNEELQCDENGKLRTDFQYFYERSPNCPLSEVK